MGRHVCLRPLLHAAFAVCLVACAAPIAVAEEASYCLTCRGPDQTYVCRVVGEGSRPSDALKLYCVIRTAKEGNHASCSAERGSPACNGLEKIYSYDGPSIPPDLAGNPRVKRLMDKAGDDQQTFAKPKGNAPKTLVELTGRAVTASRKGWRNARSAVGGSPEAEDQALTTSGEAQPLSAPSEAPLSYTEAAAASAAAPPSPSRVQRAKLAAQNAGSAVGGFARKSYRCVRSLFRRCSADTADGQPLQ